MSTTQFDGQDSIDLLYLEDQFQDLDQLIEDSPKRTAKELSVLKKRWNEEIKYHLSSLFKISNVIDSILALNGVEGRELPDDY